MQQQVYYGYKQKGQRIGQRNGIPEFQSEPVRQEADAVVPDPLLSSMPSTHWVFLYTQGADDC